MAKISIYTGGATGTREFESTANTWGELKSELSSSGITTNGITAVVGETEVTLESSNAQLPSTDWTLFLLPNKVKSGYDEDENDIDDDWNPSEDNDDYEDDEFKKEEGENPSLLSLSPKNENFEEQTIVLKIQIIKELLKELEDYFAKKGKGIDMGKEEKMRMKAEELMYKIQRVNK